MSPTTTPFDWSSFDKHAEDTCSCRCGAYFRSHGRFFLEPKPHIESRKPCPSCGKVDDLKGVHSDPETMEIRR